MQEFNNAYQADAQQSYGHHKEYNTNHSVTECSAFKEEGTRIFFLDNRLNIWKFGSCSYFCNIFWCLGYAALNEGLLLRFFIAKSNFCDDFLVNLNDELCKWFCDNFKQFLVCLLAV